MLFDHGVFVRSLQNFLHSRRQLHSRAYVGHRHLRGGLREDVGVNGSGECSPPAFWSVAFWASNNTVDSGQASMTFVGSHLQSHPFVLPMISIVIWSLEGVWLKSCTNATIFRFTALSTNRIKKVLLKRSVVSFYGFKYFYGRNPPSDPDRLFVDRRLTLCDIFHQLLDLIHLF